jgi:hypothetical protein
MYLLLILYSLIHLYLFDFSNNIKTIYWAVKTLKYEGRPRIGEEYGDQNSPRIKR